MVRYIKLVLAIHLTYSNKCTVRNRAKEIAELLSDLDRVRQERRKAKTNRNKYTGVGNDGMGFGSGRYGGFSSDDYYSGGGGGGYSGSEL